MRHSSRLKMAAEAGRILLNILLGLILAANLWLIVSRVWMGQEIPSVAGYAPVYVLSGSMEPAFSAGDMIIVHPEERYEPGDIITFHSEGELVTHRIVGASPNGFTVKGDANNVKDEELVHGDEIVGKMVLVLPCVGSIVLFFKSIRGIFLLAAVVMAVMVWQIYSGRS